MVERTKETQRLEWQLWKPYKFVTPTNNYSKKKIFGDLIFLCMTILLSAYFCILLSLLKLHRQKTKNKKTMSSGKLK